MRFRSLLTHTCTLVIPGEETGLNPYNQPETTADREINGVPCRADSLERTTGRGATGNDLLFEYDLFLPPDYEIPGGALVRDIKDQQGREIFPGTYEIDNISPIYKRRALHHYELTLQRQEG